MTVEGLRGGTGTVISESDTHTSWAVPVYEYCLHLHAFYFPHVVHYTVLLYE